MSKSKRPCLPGAYDELNGTLVHWTWSPVKPSFSATAYATADSKPSPFVGSFLANHGSYAGESVPIVSVPAVRTLSAAQAAGSAAADSLPDSVGAGSSAPVVVLLSTGAQAMDRKRRGAIPSARRRMCMRA